MFLKMGWRLVTKGEQKDLINQIESDAPENSKKS